MDMFELRVRAASAAAWWVVIFATVLFLASWTVYIVVVPAEPAWMLSLWGPDVDWTFIRSVWFWGLAGFKAMIWMMVLAALWLTLWARQLRSRASTAR